jgi:hypothetical protein
MPHLQRSSATGHLLCRTVSGAKHLVSDCCTCCTASCVNCTDGPTVAPSFYHVAFAGVSFATDCLAVTNMGHTAHVNYAKFSTEDADVGDFLPAGYTATVSASCVWGVSGDNFSTGLLPHGPEFEAWFEGRDPPYCGFHDSIEASIHRIFAIRFHVDASEILAEVFHFPSSTTDPFVYSLRSPALSFQGTTAFDGRCRATWTIPNGITSAGVYPSYFALDGDGNPVNCAGLGVGGSMTITPCGEAGI